MVLTDFERAVLAHVLIIETPDEWVARNEARVGRQKTRAWLNAKVARWRGDYLRADKTDYKTAKQRYDEERLKNAG